MIIEPRGDTAQGCIEREQPDLVLLDIMLPGKDGMTLCRDLRPVYPGPIVLLTSLDSDMNHILSLEMGAHGYSIAVAYQGHVYVEASSLGGASFRFCWPVKSFPEIKTESA